MAENIRFSYEEAEKILDYWFTMELLAQPPYPDHRTAARELQKYKKKRNGRQSTLRFVRDFDDAAVDLYEVMQAEAAALGMQERGNFTVYIGKIRREACIDAIAASLPSDPAQRERVEANTDYIALASIQLTSDGTYVAGSLSLSTILWAMNQLYGRSRNLSQALDTANYNEEVKEWEKKFFQRNENDKKEDEEAVRLQDLQQLYHEIVKVYIRKNFAREIEKFDCTEIYGVEVWLFKDRDTKEKKDENDYSGLSHSYFIEDIKLVLDKVRKREALPPALLEYITCLAHEDRRADQRFDIVHPRQDMPEQLARLNSILHIKNAPDGKWPSRFQPAFMQQVAINIASPANASKFADSNVSYGTVFSVNGPPGTGKTTLLKEIVVNNVVERAKLLAGYEKPDDAFEAHAFKHGDKAGNAYSRYVRNWYQLKNDRINDYSILVTSCNNAAVENISKELPRSISGDLKPLNGDSEALQKMLKEVSDLFDPEKSGVTEHTSRGAEYPDIYFTRYAQDLLGDETAWGLIAAPLGKKSNISPFYNKVIHEIRWDFYRKKDFAEQRLAFYKKAREDFLKQAAVVSRMKSEISRISGLLEKKNEEQKNTAALEEQVPRKRNEAAARCKQLSVEINRMILYRERAQEKMQVLQGELEGFLREAAQKENLLELRRKEKRDLEKQLADNIRQMGLFTMLFNKRKYESALKLQNDLEDEKKQVDAKTAAIQRELAVIKESMEKKKAEIEEERSELDWVNSEVSAKQNEIKTINERQDQLQKQYDHAKAQLKQLEKAYRVSLKAFQDSDMDSAPVLDEEYVRKLYSADISDSTKAQVENPWFTQRYNREREKLFALAIRLNKEFVLSTNHCRDNLITLGQYWGLETGDDKEKIKFDKEDKLNFVTSLYQTLFLFVPVISSTFASVGSLLRDAKDAGVIGTLIVDEAGQAQPQMAVGALYKSRRAVIVGDPKQVEPVVTDDLALLKSAYTDEVLIPYRGKTISVQSFADSMNLTGTYLDNGTEYPEWVGSPLLVHRRCISPMYDISNEISYNGIMKQQTAPPKAGKKFARQRSEWINVAGKEKGNRNHFVEAQAVKVCEILEDAFSISDEPGIYIISPFTSVVSGIRNYIGEYFNRPETEHIKDYMLSQEYKRIGTVHTFQGKEADEVIFLLGCDDSREAKGAVQWVNANIVNVAATRAKYRLYVIGDANVWKNSACVSKAKEIMDRMSPPC